MPGMPKPGRSDKFGGWLCPVDQAQFGHRARKPTTLYICGIEPAELPTFPLVLGEPSHVVRRTKRDRIHRPEVSKAEREHTPPDFAHWLVEIASLCADEEGARTRQLIRTIHRCYA